MSKYKVGDRVCLEAEIRQVDIEPYGVPYNVKFLNGATMWTDESNIFSISKTYEDGLADAWELARKICGYGKDSIDGSTLGKMFEFGNTGQIMTKNTYQEALAKIEAYEESKAIKVGDVVYADDEPDSFGVVTHKDSERLYIMWNDGSSNKETDWSDIHKTGRTVDIEHLLEQIRGGNE